MSHPWRDKTRGYGLFRLEVKDPISESTAALSMRSTARVTGPWLFGHILMASLTYHDGYGGDLSDKSVWQQGPPRVKPEGTQE